MKRIFLIGVAIFLSLSSAVSAQSINKSSALRLKDLNTEMMKKLFRMTPLEYFNVSREKYDTPLKEKKFLESAEYKKMEKEYNQLIKKKTSQLYVASFPFTSHYEIYNESFYIYFRNFPYYIDSYDSHFSSDSFRTPSIDENTAYKIEENPCEFVMYAYLTGNIYYNQLVLNPVEIEIRNRNTKKVYYSYHVKTGPEEVLSFEDATRGTLFEVFPGELQDDLDDITQGFNDLNSGSLTEFVEEKEPEPEPKTEEKTEEKRDIIEMVEEKPQFPGGDQAMYTWISTHLRYPASAVKENAQGRVVVQFTIDRDGSIKDARVVRSIHPDLDKEALRVVKTMPKWIPGKNNGVPVRITQTLPITFKLQ